MSAALGDVTKSQVHRLYEQGMPRHSADAARAWRLQNLELSRTADSRIDRPQLPAPAAPPPPAASQPADAPDSADENTAAYRVDRARNERLKADRAEIELEQLRGSLISLQDVEESQFTAGRIMRDRVLMVPARFASDLHAHVCQLVPEEHRQAVAAAMPMQEIERRLADELREALVSAAREIANTTNDDEDPAE